jgi:hypothetical protein
MTFLVLIYSISLETLDVVDSIVLNGNSFFDKILIFRYYYNATDNLYKWIQNTILKDCL